MLQWIHACIFGCIHRHTTWPHRKPQDSTTCAVSIVAPRCHARYGKCADSKTSLRRVSSARIQHEERVASGFKGSYLRDVGEVVSQCVIGRSLLMLQLPVEPDSLHAALKSTPAEQ